MDDEQESQPQPDGIPPAGANGHGSLPGSPEGRDPSVPDSADAEQSRKLTVYKATGPRTPQRKQRSTHNAIKHGIFSQVTVLPGESVSRYRSLLWELRDELQPEGKLEEILVEKLANIIWRQRRYLLFEGVEISHGRNFIAKAERLRQKLEVEKREDRILERHLESFVKFRRKVKARGLDTKQDSHSFTKFYKGSAPPISFELSNKWDKIFSDAATGNPSMPQGAPEEHTAWYLREIDGDIRKLRDVLKRIAMRKPEDKIEEATEDVEDEDEESGETETIRLDHLLRYEASLERAFDRTLNQLERVQRQRRGQPVPPQIDVNISSES